MNLRAKGPLLLVIAGAVITGGAGLQCYKQQGSYIQANKTARLTEIAEQLKTGFDGLNRSSKGYAELFASMPEVKRALKADDRDALAEALEPTFKLMKARYGAEAGSFYMDLPAHKDPATGASQPAGLYSVLRLTDTKNRQEFDQSKRDMLIRADHQKETQSGLEVMATTANVRGVASVDSGTEHYGCFEWGVGFSRVLDAIKVRTHSELAVFIDEKAFPAPLTARGVSMAADAAKAAESDRVATGYRTLESTNNELMRQLVTSDFLASIQQVTATEGVTTPPQNGNGNGHDAANGNGHDAANGNGNGNGHDAANGNGNGHDAGNGVAANGSGSKTPAQDLSVKREAVAGDVHYGIVGVPLFDFGGKRVGALVGVRSLDDESRVHRNTLIMFVGSTIVGLILLAGVFQILLNGLLVRPIGELTENAKAIAGGDASVKIDLMRRTDEIGALGKQLDKVRELLRLEKETKKATATEVKP